jgi:hypothetical protein
MMAGCLGNVSAVISLCCSNTQMRLSIRVASATLLSLILVAVTVLAQRGAGTPAAGVVVTPAETTTRIVASAQALLTMLDAAGRMKVQFPFDGPQKTRWSNFPSGIFERQGLRLGDLTPAQRTAVMTLLSTALSRPGYLKVTEIMRGDEVLRQTEGANGPRRGGLPAAGGRGPAGPPPQARGGARGSPPGGALAFGEDEYYLAFLGTPSTTEPWMLQFGGHHLAINLTLGANQASMTPSLPAAQPATYTVEGRTVRPLGGENDKGFALMNALDNTQRSQAILNYRVPDLVLGPGQDGRTIQPEGIRATALTPPQQTMLLDLVREWAGIMADAYAEPRMVEIRANLPQTYFAWSGPTTNGSAAYFRIQGPTLVIEYAPQGGVDHIHTIYRDPTNDYGAKLARR